MSCARASPPRRSSWPTLDCTTLPPCSVQLPRTRPDQPVTRLAVYATAPAPGMNWGSARIGRPPGGRRRLLQTLPELLHGLIERRFDRADLRASIGHQNRQLLGGHYHLAHPAAVDDEEPGGQWADPGDPRGRLAAVAINQPQALADLQLAHARRDGRIVLEAVEAASQAQRYPGFVVTGLVLRVGTGLVSGARGVGHRQRGDDPCQRVARAFGIQPAAGVALAQRRLQREQLRGDRGAADLRRVRIHLDHGVAQPDRTAMTLR